MPDSLWPHGLYSPQNSPWQNTGVGSQFPSPGDLPNPGIEPRSPAPQIESLPAEPPGTSPNTLGEMQIKTTVRYHFTTTRMAIIKKTYNNKYWTRWKEIRALIYCGGEYKMVYFLWKIIWSFSKTSNIATIGPSNFTPRYIHWWNEKTYPHKNVQGHTWMSLVVRFLMPPKWKQCKCPSTDEWTDEM